MKASLKIEAVGDCYYQEINLYRGILNSGAPGLGDAVIGQYPRSGQWVAMIIGRDSQFGYARRFLKGKKDYAHANCKGSRGVYLHYILESGYVYEVKCHPTWTRYRRYFCTVTDDGDIIEVDKEYVEQWINDHSV